MGNMICCCGRRRKMKIPPATETALLSPPMEIPSNRLVFAAAGPPHLNPNCFNQYPGYCHPPPPPYDHRHLHYYPPYSYQPPHPLIPNGRSPMMPPPYAEYTKAVTIRNEVNLKKESLRLQPDPENPNQLIVSFTFDATVPGRITVIFFAEGECNLTATKEDTFPPITFDFGKGIGHKFIQPSGTGIDLTVFEVLEQFNESETDIYPLAIKSEAQGKCGSVEITKVTFVKEKEEIKIGVVRQILWTNGSRYELHEMYGMGKVGDGSNEGKECVICLSEQRNTAVLPCRHMCMCSGCAKELRFQTNLCPVCRQPVERYLGISVDGNKNGGDGDEEI